MNKKFNFYKNIQAMIIKIYKQFLLKNIQAIFITPLDI